MHLLYELSQKPFEHEAEIEQEAGARDPFEVGYKAVKT
jgi:hypothetical protein